MGSRITGGEQTDGFLTEFDFAGAVIEIQATENIQVAGAAFPGDALKLVTLRLPAARGTRPWRSSARVRRSG